MSGNCRRLIVLTRYPLPGRVKTRLLPVLGADGAAALHRRLVLRTFRTANALSRSMDVRLEIRFDGGSERAMRHWLGDGPLYRPQGHGDLGERMAGAFEESFQEGSPATIIIGTDCPGLTHELLEVAFHRLSAHRVVIGPARDGGYFLIGLTRMVPELFCGLAWGTETVLAESLRRLRAATLEPGLLEELNDIDRPEDLPVWHRIAESEETDLKRVSVVIPALNEARHIAATVQAARRGDPREILVVDGGSNDDTVRLAQEAGATILHSTQGRARQLNAGAALATGNVLLFLHADTLLPADYVRVVAKNLQPAGVVLGAFGFRIADPFPGKWWVERTANLRSRFLRMPYGDQALFLKRSVFEELGGFADLPILDDYHFVRRLRQRGRVVTAREQAITSGRRWQRLGVIRTTVINKLVLAGYRCGISPERLSRLYR